LPITQWQNSFKNSWIRIRFTIQI